MTELEAIKDLKTQNMKFQMTIFTRLARMHHLMEDIQDKLHYLNSETSPSAPPLSVKDHEA